MDRKIRLNISSTPLDFVFILMLLCVFAFGALMSVILGANTYKGIKEDMDSNFELRTPLSYVSTKIRQNDEIDSIRIINKEGVDALVLEREDNGIPCQTWIYEYDKSLYEVYIEKGTDFELSDGLSIIPSYGLQFSLKDNLLTVTAKDHNGDSHHISLSFRTSQGGDSI